MLTENSSDSPEDGLSPTSEEAMGQPAPQKAAAEPMETVPISEEAAEEAGTPGQLLEACPACGMLMNMTEQLPFAQVYCPSCGQSLRARGQFNNYKLTELLGEGGMGSVFKAVDCNLYRNVALKILKRECSANAEERAKLEQEARVTASINHPHVVKVFSFGDDHGQFYLAMELVEKGSLDDLMGIQRRVAEAQVLDVGIQIAEGLEAAYARGLIHRDIKPGNILFSDPHTAKLVDFGLAIIMDEAAQAKGEIWGTPYYIAPEKLDNLPEDYRSDIYSLGGTLFHAVAGRPPYEAETASMVALKQLKSQPVSLQAFAPDVSSETSYVINRMLAKNPADRYQSYRELVEHLSYARHKLAERSQRPAQPKARVVMETQASKNVAALFTLGLLVVVVVASILAYVFREQLFPTMTAPPPPKKASPGLALPPGEIQRRFEEAVLLLANRRSSEAAGAFARLEKTQDLGQPMKSWIRMNHGLSLLASGEAAKAAKLFALIQKEGVYAVREPENLKAKFFVAASGLLSLRKEKIPISTAALYSNLNYEAFGLFAFGLHNWQNGSLAEAGPFFKKFSQASVAPPDFWIEKYKPLAEAYVADFEILNPLQLELAKVTDAQSANDLLKKARSARTSLQSGNVAVAYLDAIEKELLAKGATP